MNVDHGFSTLLLVVPVMILPFPLLWFHPYFHQEKIYLAIYHCLPSQGVVEQPQVPVHNFDICLFHICHLKSTPSSLLHNTVIWWVCQVTCSGLRSHQWWQHQLLASISPGPWLWDLSVSTVEALHQKNMDLTTVHHHHHQKQHPSTKVEQIAFWVIIQRYALYSVSLLTSSWLSYYIIIRNYANCVCVCCLWYTSRCV